jgi:hypothetical protein
VWVPTLILNICISIDLVILVRNPFSRHEKRVSMYLIATVLVAVASAVIDLDEVSKIEADG